ncbi:hypothetical protein [Candidatus Entotheonella palauensis]|uniref:Uncharacterized protein n=1 Tax=Candidatus Entotheonella gemina TaxID=1429439 RepID=W4LHW8_9BACT|nr:hypothetical protein [Candidatus Entotheonella palauensis]ETW97285.1 MAG: hypothetical protein ETSY2_44875 [Candidatus Entotheonella gemina]
MANVVALIFVLLPAILVPCFLIFLVAYLVAFLTDRSGVQRGARCVCKRPTCQVGKTFTSGVEAARHEQACHKQPTGAFAASG